MEATAQGRIRYRSDSLKIKEKAESVKDTLEQTAGVIKVSVSKRVGSVLIFFDKAKIKAEQLLKKVAECLHINTEKITVCLRQLNSKITGRTGRRVVKRGMLGAGVVTLGLLMYSDDWHAVGGVVWASLMAVHLYQNKRTLFS